MSSIKKAFMKAMYNIKNAKDLVLSLEEPTKKFMTTLAAKIADGTLQGVQILGEATLPQPERKPAFAYEKVKK